MYKVLLGCPYTGLANVKSAFQELDYDIDLLLAEDIGGINGDKFSINAIDYKFEEINASFVRYPYDLIPPHTENYLLREETEYYKTIALLSDAVAINKLASTWQFRNRAYSLLKARESGCITPEFWIHKNNSEFKAEKSNIFAVKAIGNCFVSEHAGELSNQKKEYLSIEEDDGDVAAVFPASVFDKKQLLQYLSLFGHAFCQQLVQCSVELRCYLVENRLFVYQREDIGRFDKSFASYLPTTCSVSTKTKDSITKMASNNGLKYLCFDIVVDDKGAEYVIDINPYGSFPPFDQLPDVSIELAECLFKRAKNG